MRLQFFAPPVLDFDDFRPIAVFKETHAHVVHVFGKCHKSPEVDVLLATHAPACAAKDTAPLVVD
jgi:hypothetical protein